MNWKAKISLVSLLLIPVVVLVALGILWLQPDATSMDVESDPFFQEASWLGPGGHELIPNLQEAEIITPDRPHDPIEARTPEKLAQVSRRRHFLISTNSMGLRGPELPAKTDFRILCLGESVTFGWGVSAAEAYPAQLADRLGVDVINAGIPAMRPGHMARWLQRHAASIQADLILFTVRPDWMQPDPWADYFQSIRSAQRIVAPTPIAVVLPPISTFDIRGTRQRGEELAQLEANLQDVPWIDLTPAFREALPTEGVTLTLNGDTQQMIDRRSNAVLVEATPTDPLSLAPEIVDALEADHNLVEPLMFDGAHPDADGFVVFAHVVASFIEQQGWR